jgi:hypothetical protein
MAARHLLRFLPCTVLTIRRISSVCTQLYRTARGGGNDQEQESFWSQRAASDPQAPK